MSATNSHQQDADSVTAGFNPGGSDPSSSQSIVIPSAAGGMKRNKSSAILSEEMAMMISLDREHYNYSAPGNDDVPSDNGEGRDSNQDNEALLSKYIDNEGESLHGSLRQRGGNIKQSLPSVLTEDDIEEQFGTKNHHSLPGYVHNYCKKAYDNFSFKRSLINTFPVINSVLNGYNLDFLQRDILLGVTLAIIMIPQGLAYALITNIPPQYGLFACFLPPIIYIFFGSALENSVGPFALTSIVIAQQVASIAPELADMAEGPERMMATVGVVLTLSFTTGILLIIMSILRLGWVVSLISEPALNSYVTAITTNILLGQVGSLLKLPTPADSKFIGCLKAIFGNIPDINVCSMLIGLATFFVILLVDMFARWRKFSKPIPSQIFMVIVTTLCSWGFDFQEKYDIKITGEIKTGLPVWDFPSLDNLGKYMVPSIILAMVIFILTISVAKQLAIANGRQLDYNQELLALGACSFIGAMFQSHAASGSLARSAVANNLRPGSIFWNVFKAFVVLLVLLWLAPLLKHLPAAALAGIIIAALRGWIFNMLEPITLWKKSSSDFIAYVIVFFITLFTDTTIGMIAAAACSIVVLFAQISRPDFTVLARLPGLSIYKDTKAYPQAQLDDNVLIVSFNSQLHFANQDYFCDKITEQINIKLAQIGKREEEQVSATPIIDLETGERNDASDQVSNLGSNARAAQTSLKNIPHCFPDSLLSSRLSTILPPNLRLAVVINCSSINDIDLTSANMLTRLTARMKKDILYVFAGCNRPVKRMLRMALSPHLKYPGMLMFQSIDESVRFARACVNLAVLTRFKGVDVKPSELTAEQLEIISGPPEDPPEAIELTNRMVQAERGKSYGDDEDDEDADDIDEDNGQNIKNGEVFVNEQDASSRE